MGWVKTWWTRIRIYWHIHTTCRVMTVDPERNEYGTFNAWFCRRHPWHRGEHRDTRYDGAVWDR